MRLNVSCPMGCCTMSNELVSDLMSKSVAHRTVDIWVHRPTSRS